MNKLKELYSILITVLAGLILALFISIYVFQPTMVIGKSMEPTLPEHHRIYVSKLPRLVHYTPTYGDIIILDSRIDQPRTFIDDLTSSPLLLFLFPHQTQHRIWVKRVIGKAGDAIEIKNGRVYRNGVQLDEPYIKELMQPNDSMAITVPPGHIFVMGDNRNYSKDSRSIGAIPVDHVLGVKI